MKPATPAPCVLGVGIETLSALRDNALTLPNAEIERLWSHISTCGACQARLASFDRVAKALRRQRDLEPDRRN